ncbi:hypothetical protein HQ535_03270 [bacterium]|nr:hypothetical protein [bacterium]
MAAITAGQLPPDVGASVIEAANQAFVDAMTTGFQISAIILLTAVIIAFTLIPKRMRTAQAVEAGESMNPVFAPDPIPEAAAA